MAKSNAMQKMRAIAHSTKSDVNRHLDESGTWKGQITHSQVLGMTYIQPSVSEGGVHLPDNAQVEDRLQGKCFLIIEMGPGAFKDDKIAQFHGIKPGKLTWFMARPSDGLEFFYKGNTLRLFQDVDIRTVDINPRDFY